MLWYESKIVREKKNITIIVEEYLNIFFLIKTRTNIFFNICRNVRRVTEGNKKKNYMLIRERRSYDCGKLKNKLF